MDFDPTSSRPLDQSNNIFSKRVPTVKNHVPINLKMLRLINPQTRKLDEVVQVYKVVLIVKVLSTTIKLGNKMEIQIYDEESQQEGKIFLFTPNFIAEQFKFNDNQFYKFICTVKVDHGQPILNCVIFAPVKNQHQIQYHKNCIKVAELDRKRMRMSQMQKNKQYQI